MLSSNVHIFKLSIIIIFLPSLSCQDFKWRFLRFDPSVTYEVLTAVNVKITVFSDVMSRSQISTSCHLILTIKTESVHSSKMLVCVRQTTQQSHPGRQTVTH